LPNGVLSNHKATERANTFVDLHIVGRDAERAGRMLGMSRDPFFVYDQPRDHPELEEKLQELVRKHNLDARFEVISRVPHRERINAALKHGVGGGEVQFHGIWAAVVEGAPVNRSLCVVGERMPAPDQDKWKRVVAECNTQCAISRSEKVGHVAVDYARLMIADFDALGAWHHEDSLDGLADYIFWGRDAEKVAQACKAPRLTADEFGWINVSEALAQERGTAVEEHRQEHGLKLATDYRPHSHHWQVMRTARTSPTESGTTKVGGVIVCNFMTTWGDGIFGVYRDLSSSHELVQIRIEFTDT
jgi:hypothetical protein